jgi:hypothetical protein
MVFPGNNVVYASTTSGGGIFKSVNGGATWARFVTGLGDDRINGLVQHPTNPNVLFALTQRAGLKRIDLTTSSTWTTVGAPARSAGVKELETAGPLAPPPPPDPVFEEAPLVEPEEDPGSQALLAAGTTAEVTSIAFAPSNANIAYFGTYGDGVYSSTSGGVSWIYAGQPGGIVRSLAVSRSNTRIIYAATNSAGFLRLSTNGGVDWNNLPLPDASLSAYSLLILPEDPASLFVGTNNGVYRYRSNVWTKVGLANLQVYRLGYNPGSPKMFFAGTNRGAYLSTLSSLPSWTLVVGKMSQEEVVSLNFDPSTRRDIYLGSNGRGTLKVFLP